MTTEVSFTAKDVMALRQKTGLGMMECKKALAETNGDPAAAEELLRTRLKGKMAERTERATAEGRIGIAVDGANAVIVEIRTETDFTAKNDDFKAMVEAVTKAKPRENQITQRDGDDDEPDIQILHQFGRILWQDAE